MTFARNISAGVATLTFDRPETVNAISAVDFAALGDALQALRGDQGVSCVVLRGAGKNFSSGADIKEPGPPPQELLAGPIDLHPTALLYGMPQLTVAAIRGYCLGGALELALATDIRIAASDAVFGFGEIDWALTTGWGGAVLLEQIVGRGTALHLLLTGEKFDAQEALRLGIVSEVAPAGQFEDRILSLSRTFASAPKAAAAAFRRLLAKPSIEARLQEERETFAMVSQTDEARHLLSTFGRAGDKIKAGA